MLVERPLHWTARVPAKAELNASTTCSPICHALRLFGSVFGFSSADGEGGCAPARVSSRSNPFFPFVGHVCPGLRTPVSALTNCPPGRLCPGYPGRLCPPPHRPCRPRTNCHP